MKPYFFRPLFQSLGDRTVRMVEPSGGPNRTARSSPHAWPTCAGAQLLLSARCADLCAPSVKGARSQMGGTAQVGPGLLLSPSLGPLCAQMLPIFVRPKYARAVLRADASVRCTRCDEPHAVHRQEPPRAASSSTIPEPVRALTRLAGPPANARRFCSVAAPIMWALSQARAMLQVRRAAPIW